MREQQLNEATDAIDASSAADAMRDTAALAGRVVVVTGASSGIGAATAELAARYGAVPVLVARRESALLEVAARCGPQAIVLVADVTERAAVRGVVTETIRHAGRIDVWVNNAGRGITRLPSALTDEDIDEMMRANVRSALYGMQEVLPHFRARGTGQIINVSSMLGRVPIRTYRSAYSGAKHFLNALTADFRSELAAELPGVRVSLVSPGAVATAFGDRALHGGPASHLLRDPQRADEVARVIVDVILRPRDDVYTRVGSREQVLAYLGALGQDP